MLFTKKTQWKKEEEKQNDQNLTNRMVLSSLWMCDSLVIVRMFFETPQILYQPLCASQYSLFNQLHGMKNRTHFYVSHTTNFQLFFTFTFHSENGKNQQFIFIWKHERKNALTQLCFMQLFFCITTYLLYAKNCLNCMLTTKTMMMN